MAEANFLDIDEVRAEMAKFLSANSNKRHSLDAALMHVVKLAFEEGLRIGKEMNNGN